MYKASGYQLLKGLSHQRTPLSKCGHQSDQLIALGPAPGKQLILLEKARHFAYWKGNVVLHGRHSAKWLSM